MWINILIGVVVFCSTFLLDVVQTSWLVAFNARRANRASALGVAEWCIGAVVFYAFLGRSWYFALPEVAGLYVGSQFGIRRLARRERDQVSPSLSTQDLRDR